MLCPKCDGKIKVLDVRNTKDNTYRKRQCKTCSYVFYTSEHISDKYKFTQAPDRKKGANK